MKNPLAFSYLSRVPKNQQYVDKAGYSKNQQYEDICHLIPMFPIQADKEREKVQLKPLLAFASNAGYQKNNPFVGLIFAFRDEDKRISQTDCTGGGY